MLPQPQQRRVAEDLDRRLNVLFDALNCETLSKPVVELLIPLTQCENFCRVNTRPL